MREFNAWEYLALTLVVVGALNWGLVGLFGLDLVASLFGAASILSRVIYVAVGLSGLYLAIDAIAKAMATRRAHPAGA
jgi:hypothetical protein